MTALEVLTRYAHAPVGLRARREDDLMVVTPEVRQRDVLSEIDRAIEAEARIGRDPGAHEPVGRGQPVDHVDLDDDALMLQEVIRRVVAGRSRADDGNAQRM